MESLPRDYAYSLPFFGPHLATNRTFFYSVWQFANFKHTAKHALSETSPARRLSLPTVTEAEDGGMAIDGASDTTAAPEANNGLCGWPLPIIVFCAHVVSSTRE